MAHAITTSTCIHHASKVVVEANTIVNDRGQETKWVTFSVRNAEGIEEVELTMFDLDLTDVILMPSTQGVETLVNSADDCPWREKLSELEGE